MAGYHKTTIRKGVLGELSKIQEELDEAVDSEAQDVKIMTLLELADIMGAMEAYLEKHFPDFTLSDVHKMKDLTKDAFKSGDRL